eukprot:CAMPEP_0185768618 /NCGR_PEP_ID=MMETSP1174-20130828/51020_1 /TAXON_ID=35687 /ORGANISM="Dictyocha speculum, Strain CCMP1381" /LENGTH=218 /DNA_ID=CAMNT_0028453393 /DNA_START=17 /DNA_END=673 /DNA_ORIENTATION=+
MTNLLQACCISCCFLSAQGFTVKLWRPHATGFKSPPRAFSRLPVVAVAEKYMCDCCGLDPIVGVRFQCTNVEGIDMCSTCATDPGQTFSAGKLQFSQLAWQVHAVVEDKQPEDPDDDDEDDVADVPGLARMMNEADAGPPPIEDQKKGAKFSTLAPDADDYADDKSFRQALRENVLKNMDERRSAGTVGNQAQMDYMRNLQGDDPDGLREEAAKKYKS